MLVVSESACTSASGFVRVQECTCISPLRDNQSSSHFMDYNTIRTVCDVAFTAQQRVVFFFLRVKSNKLGVCNILNSKPNVSP